MSWNIFVLVVWAALLSPMSDSRDTVPGYCSSHGQGWPPDSQCHDTTRKIAVHKRGDVWPGGNPWCTTCSEPTCLLDITTQSVLPLVSLPPSVWLACM